MRILGVENSRKPNGVEISGLAAKDEYKQPAGCLANIKLFADRATSKFALRHSHCEAAGGWRWYMPPEVRRGTEVRLPMLQVGPDRWTDVPVLVLDAERNGRSEDGVLSPWGWESSASDSTSRIC